MLSRFLTFKNILILLIVLAILYWSNVLNVIPISLGAFLASVVAILFSLVGNALSASIVGILVVSAYRLITRKPLFPVANKSEILRYVTIVAVVGIICSFFIGSLLHH